MISKQTKDFINDLPGVGGVSFTLKLGNDWIPYQKIDFNDEDVIMVDMNVLPKAFDDIPMGVLIAEYKKKPLAVYKNKPSLKEAIEILCNELKDEDYYRSWSANIAMAFKDEFSRCDPNLVVDHLRVHDIANNAADNFLKQLMK